MTLARDLKGQCWPGGWWASEKLDGCRAFWDGQRFWTRGGNIIAAPKWFTRGLPTVPLDGEIWAGREGFQTARVAVQNGGRWFDELSPAGHPLQFAVFDFPAAKKTWQQRMRLAERAIKAAAHAVCVPFHQVSAPQDFVAFLLHIRQLGGEGAMFRNPASKVYELGRSDNLLRFKFCQ